MPENLATKTIFSQSPGKRGKLENIKNTFPKKLEFSETFTFANTVRLDYINVLLYYNLNI